MARLFENALKYDALMYEVEFVGLKYAIVFPTFCISFKLCTFPENA